MQIAQQLKDAIRREFKAVVVSLPHRADEAIRQNANLSGRLSLINMEPLIYIYRRRLPFNQPLCFTPFIINNFPVSVRTTSNIIYIIHFLYMAFNCFRTYAQCNRYFLCTNFSVLTNQLYNLSIQFILRDILGTSWGHLGDILGDIIIQIQHHYSKLIYFYSVIIYVNMNFTAIFYINVLRC